jgi:DNA invertase Pin-like site-specific DNA recombinase
MRTCPLILLIAGGGVGRLMAASRTKFGRKRYLTADRVKEIKVLREAGTTVPEIMRQTKLSKASVYRALGA